MHLLVPKANRTRKKLERKKEEKTYLYDKTLFLPREIKRVLTGFAGRGKPVTIHAQKSRIQKAGELVADLARHISCLPGKATFVKPAFSQANPIPEKGLSLFLTLVAG